MMIKLIEAASQTYRLCFQKINKETLALCMYSFNTYRVTASTYFSSSGFLDLFSLSKQNSYLRNQRGNLDLRKRARIELEPMKWLVDPIRKRVPQCDFQASQVHSFMVCVQFVRTVNRRFHYLFFRISYKTKP